MAITEGDVERALLLLPSPLFRQRDIYDVAVALGFRPFVGTTLWNYLRSRHLIEPTAQPIGNYRNKFYWRRVSACDTAAR